MLQLLLASVSSSALLAGSPPVDPPNAIEPPEGPTHAIPSADRWRLRFWGGPSTPYFSLAEIEFRGEIGGTDLATGGTAIASSERSGFEAVNAFDDDSGTFHSQDRTDGGWVGYVFGSAVTIREFTVTARPTNSDHTPTVIALECSTDAGVTWDMVDLFSETEAYGASETRRFTVGTGGFDLRNTRVGYASTRDIDVEGGVYVAHHDLWVTFVYSVLSSYRVADCTVCKVDGTTHEIEEILAVAYCDDNTNVPYVEFDEPIFIEEGESFAILWSANETEPDKNIRLRFLTEDYHPVVATDGVWWGQATENITVGAAPTESDPGNYPLIFFGGTWNNKNGPEIDTDDGFWIPPGIPRPVVWFSPNNVTTDGSGNVTTIHNRGVGGSYFDATPSSGAYATIETRFDWNYTPVFVLPESTGAGYEFADTPAKAGVTTATYGTGSEVEFSGYRGLFSGPTRGVTNELELMGWSGGDIIYTSRPTRYVFDGVASAGSPTVLPMVRRGVGVEKTNYDEVLVGTLFRDSNNNRWLGVVGDTLLFSDPLPGKMYAWLWYHMNAYTEYDYGVNTVVPEATSYVIHGTNISNQRVPNLRAYVIHEAP